MLAKRLVEGFDRSYPLVSDFLRSSEFDRDAWGYENGVELPPVELTNAIKQALSGNLKADEKGLYVFLDEVFGVSTLEKPHGEGAWKEVRVFLSNGPEPEADVQAAYSIVVDKDGTYTVNDEDPDQF